MTPSRTRCAYPRCGEELDPNEPRVRVVWQAGTHAGQGSATRTTFHEGCWRQIERVLEELRARAFIEL